MTISFFGQLHMVQFSSNERRGAQENHSWATSIEELTT
jgi:hypothetical protein